MKRLHYVLSSVGLLLLAGMLVIVVRTATLSTLQPEPSAVVVDIPTDAELAQAAAHLAGAIRLGPITFEDTTQIDRGAFLALFDSLEAWYPLVHSELERERFGHYSLLFRWEGSEPDADAIVLASHLDVVPVPEETAGEWDVDPFAGVIRDGFVWGRGAIDDKSSVIGFLEAIERLLASGFEPQQDIYLVLGGDEERGGYKGAARMAEVLDERGVRASFVLDEGLFIVNDVVPGVSGPVALIGIAEKGAASIELSVQVEGGHASMPSGDMALAILGRAIDRLVENPLEPTLVGVPEAMFGYLAPEMGLVQRAVFANLWLFSPVVLGQLENGASSNALIRTTIAPTIFQAGTKVNVLPATASAFLNIRLRPGDSVSGVVEELARRIDDERVRIEVLEGASEPSAVSPVDAPAFGMMAQTFRNVFPEAVVAPALMVARTDSRHYSRVTESVFKITPVMMESKDLKRVHGVNERLSIEGLGRAIQFYMEMIHAAQLL